MSEKEKLKKEVLSHLRKLSSRLSLLWWILAFCMLFTVIGLFELNPNLKILSTIIAAAFMLYSPVWIYFDKLIEKVDLKHIKTDYLVRKNKVLVIISASFFIIILIFYLYFDVVSQVNYILFIFLFIVLPTIPISMIFVNKFFKKKYSILLE